MKFVTTARGTPARYIAAPVSEDPTSAQVLAMLAAAVNRIGRNEFLHLFMAAVIAAILIATIV